MSINNPHNTRVSMEVAPEWQRLMRVAEQIGKGQATIMFNEGRPVQVNVAIKKIALDKEEDMAKLRVISLN